jgi:hypothetical protein
MHDTQAQKAQQEHGDICSRISAAYRSVPHPAPAKKEFATLAEEEEYLGEE